MVNKLREIRKARGMTQEMLSKASRVNRVNIAKYENGKSTPSLQSAERLAGALNVTVDDLINNEEGKAAAAGPDVGLSQISCAG